ncbi:Uncharacterised protein [Segatella copri]|nr:Uncharacterised protein [Segatella copri]
MKINQCMLRTSKILTTLRIHRLHDKRCDMRSLVWRSLFYLNFHYTILILLFLLLLFLSCSSIVRKFYKDYFFHDC